MITTGRKQLIGVAIFFVAVALLGALLMQRRDIRISQQRPEAEVVALESRIKAATDPATRQRLEMDRLDTRDEKAIARIDADLKKIKDDSGKVSDLKDELKKAQDHRDSLMPKWVHWLSWGLPLLALVAFMGAMGSATEHGRRFLVTVTIALVAGGFFYFRGVSQGIDLRGGAELRYQLDTSAIDREIAELETLRGAMTKEPAETRKKLQTEIDDKEKERNSASSSVIKTTLEQRINLLKSYLEKDGVKNRIGVLQAQRSQDMSKAVDIIRRRIDAAGIREISVQTGSEGRIIVQVPIKNILLSDAEIAARLRAADGAAKWEQRGQADRDEMVGKEKSRLRLEQLALDVNALQRIVETPGMLAFNDVDACNGYQRDAERWQKMLDWDQKLAGLQKELAALTDKAKRSEIEARIAALQAKNPAPGFVLREYDDVRNGKAFSEKLLLREKPVTTGDTLTRAIVTGTPDGVGQEVLVYLDASGGAAMERYTDENNPDYNVKYKETRMAIVLDGVIKSAPSIESRLGTNFRITGRFSKEEADQLAQVLNAGSLAFKPARESVQVVGPGLGEDAISAGVRAALVGSVLVVAFMFCYYLAGGIAANLALGLNILMILGGMSLLGGTMTLPGIAGIALTVGMAVDANVLIFERVREEKARGKPLKLALKAGQERALVTILDSNFTTLIIAFFLYRFGTGAVKGFAVTLAMGLLTNLFTALYVSKAAMEYMLGRGWLTEFKMLKIIGVPKFPFMRLTPAAMAVSAVLLAASIYLFIDTPNKYGLDFTGGMEVQVRLADRSDTGAVRAVAEKVKERMEAYLRSDAKAAPGSTAIGEFGVQAYEPDAAGRSQQFRMSCQVSSEQQQALDKFAGTGGGEQGIRAFFGAGFADGGIKLDATDPFPMTSKIGSRAASELRGKAIMAFAFSLVAMFFYIVLRFDFMVGFGLGAAVTLFHDAILATGTLMLANRLGLAGAQIDLVIVAALLTIIGYSINDTIVVFDRIRENRAAMRSLPFGEVIDLAINQTLSRTILTSFTVFVSTACLLTLGGGTLRPFALVFMIGVITGTYSSVLAAWIGLKYENWREVRREALKQKLRSAPAQTT